MHVDYFDSTTVGHIARGYSELMARPDVDSFRYALNDMRGLKNLNVFYDGMMQMAKTISADSSQRPKPVKIAMVANQRDMVPLLTDYCAQIAQAEMVSCNLFSEIIPALEWLSPPPEVVDLCLPDGRRISEARARA